MFFAQRKRHNSGGGASPLGDPAAPGLYYRYVCALAREEQAAAELERIINLHAGALPGPGPVPAGSHPARPRGR